MTTIDTTGALGRFDNDKDIYLDLISTFLEMSAIDFDIMRSDLGAGQMEKVMHQIHQLKGAALTLGADQLARSSSLLESALKNGAAETTDKMLTEIQRNYRESILELALIQDQLRKQP